MVNFKSGRWQMSNYRNSMNVLRIKFTVAILLCSFLCYSQKIISLNQVLDSIQAVHPVGRMYDADIRSMDEAAKGAKSWMPPEVGAGFFMTPYNPQKWKKMSDMEPGMGSFMISLQQMFPNPKKLNAEAAYMQSMSGSVREQKNATLNELYAQAKKSIFRMDDYRKEKNCFN